MNLSEKLRHCLTAAVLILIFFAFAIQRQVGMLICTAACLAYGIAAGKNIRPTTQQFLLLCLGGLLFLPGFFKPYHGLSPIYYFVATVSSLLVASTLTQQPRALHSAFRFTFWFSASLIFYFIFKYQDHPEPLGMIVEGSSTNGIPAYLIILQIGLSLSTYVVTGKLPVSSVIVTSVVAFYGIGRGSLVVCALMLAGTLFFNLFATKQKFLVRIHMIALVGSGIFIFALLYWETAFDFLLRYTKLSVGLVDVNRIEIWSQYSEKMNPYTLLWGSDYTGTSIQTRHNDNPHIAYLRTHSYYGLPLAVIALASPLLIWTAKKSRASKLVFFFFISLAALRALSEPILFPTLLDAIYFIYFFLFFRHAK